MSRKLKYFASLITGSVARKWAKLPNGLYAFTYHRVGDSRDTPFDENVFSCSAVTFKKQMCFIAKHFKIIDMASVEKMMTESQPLQYKYAVITFDDGYLDNYDIAFPILRELSIPATFFVTTDYISAKVIPWWDEIAWMVKNTQVKKIQYSSADTEINLQKTVGRHNAIWQLLTQVKADRLKSMKKKLSFLKKELKVDYLACSKEKALFMNWQQVITLSKQGMTIGAHTLNHPILSHLSQNEQHKQLAESKIIIEKHTGIQVNTLAYPVGAKDSYNQDTINILSRLGYKLAFTYLPGINREIKENNFTLKRFPIECSESPKMLKFLITQ